MGIVYIQSEGEPELPSLFRPEIGEGLYFSPRSEEHTSELQSH